MTQVDGINPGDVVANSSFDKLQDNARVAVAATRAIAGTATGDGKRPPARPRDQPLTQRISTP